MAKGDFDEMRSQTSIANAVGALATALALVMTSGCGGGNQCNPACQPACPSGTICSADVHGHTNPVWRGVCLQLCSQPSDCTGGLACRSFGDSAPYVCASDDLPTICDPAAKYYGDLVGDLSDCKDAQTLAAVFGPATNGTSGLELRTCANGCEALFDAAGVPSGARCR
jgi:hypothetical protein